MDLPIVLEDMAFVSSIKEIRQTIKVLLQNPRGMFYQSVSLGSFVAIHSSDNDEIVEGVRETVTQIPGLKVVNCYTKDNEVILMYTYQSEPDTFHFSVDTL